MTIRGRDKAALAVIACVALIAGFYVLVLSPQHKKVTHLGAAITAQQAALAKAQQQYVTGHSAAVALARSTGQWTQARRAVPQVSNIPALLKLLQENAAAAGVSLETVSLDGGSQSSSSSPTTQDGATTIPISLTFDGGYQALNRVVSRLDKLVVLTRGEVLSFGPLVGIGSVSLTPDSTGGSASTLSVQLTTNIYQQAAATTVEAPASGGSS